MKRALSTIAVNLLGWAVALIWIVPFFGLLMTSIRPFSEVIDGWWSFNPFTPTFENFSRAWGHSSFPLALGMRNSLIVAIPSTVLPLLVASLAAYGFARFRFPIKNLIFIVIVIMMALPPQMIAIPVFMMMKGAHLLDTFLGLILVHSAWGAPWIIFFMRNFFSTLPIEVEEAARVDGASDFTIFFRIVLPMCLPALVSVAVLQFMWVWSDFFFPLILLYSSEKLVAVQLLPLMRGQYFIDWGLLSAATIMVMLVPVLVFALLQRYYIRGMVGWAVK